MKMELFIVIQSQKIFLLVKNDYLKLLIMDQVRLLKIQNQYINKLCLEHQLLLLLRFQQMVIILKKDFYSLGVLIYVTTFGKHFISAQSQFEFLAQLMNILNQNQLQLPSIENSGDKNFASELVDFLKIKITYDERDRIDCTQLFQLFTLYKGQDLKTLESCQQFSESQKLIVKSFTQGRKSFFLQQNQSGSKYKIKEVNQLESQAQQSNLRCERSIKQSQNNEEKRIMSKSNNLQQSQPCQCQSSTKIVIQNIYPVVN